MNIFLIQTFDLTYSSMYNCTIVKLLDKTAASGLSLSTIATTDDRLVFASYNKQTHQTDDCVLLSCVLVQ